LENVFEEPEDTNTPPEPTIIRRAASYSDFYHVVRAQLTKDGQLRRKKKPSKKDRAWEALMLRGGDSAGQSRLGAEPLDEMFEKQFWEESQQEYSCVDDHHHHPSACSSCPSLTRRRLYHDQLSLTERHLDGLIDDANATLTLLTSLSDSFQSVEAQTTTFQAACEGLLQEQSRLELLADQVGTDLYYYIYLDTATRRLNAPGASRLVDDDEFGTMVENIDSCINFMQSHVRLPNKAVCKLVFNLFSPSS
jgi:hypothetical protein